MARAAHQRPVGGVHRPLPVLLQGPEGDWAAATSRRSRTGCPGVEHRMDLLHQGVVDGRDVAGAAGSRWPAPPRPGCSGSTRARARSRPGADADIVDLRPGRHAGAVGGDAPHERGLLRRTRAWRSPGGCDTVLSRGRVVVDDGEYPGAAGHGRFLRATRASTWADGGIRWTSAWCCRPTRRPAAVVDMLAARRGAGVPLRLDVRLARAVAGAVRHLLADPGAATSGSIVGPMVTNPATRDWSVTASLFATLNDMFGNRTVCGIGRGDSARAGASASRRRRWPRWPTAMHVIRELAEGREVDLRRHAGADPVGARRQAGDLDGRLRAEGAASWSASRPTGSSCRPPTRTSPGGRSARSARPPRRRAATPDAMTICVAAPAYVGDDLAHQRDQLRWFGGMVGNHVADLVARYGDVRRGAAGADRLHQGPRGLRLLPPRQGRATRRPTSCPTTIVDRFCLLGPAVGARGPAGRADARSAWTSSPST